MPPPDVPKDGTWLDLPLAIIMLQAAGYLPDLPDHKEGDYIVVGELGLHGEVRRVPGVLSLAYMAKAGQKLIVPTGNEKEAALILAKPGHEGCGVYPVGLLSEVTEFFAGRRTTSCSSVHRGRSRWPTWACSFSTRSRNSVRRRSRRCGSRSNRARSL